MKIKDEFYSIELKEPADPLSMPAIDRGKLRDSGEFETQEEALAAGAEEIRFRYFTDYGKNMVNLTEEHKFRAGYRYIETIAERTAAEIVTAYKKFLAEEAAGNFYSDIAGKAQVFYENALKEKTEAIADNAEISRPGGGFVPPSVKNADKLVEAMKADIIKEKIMAGVSPCEFFQRKVKASSRSVIITGIFGSETEEERWFYNILDASAAFVEEFSRSAKSVAGGIWELIIADVREFLTVLRLELDKKL